MASSTTARAREVIAELDQFEVDMNLTNKWVHGDENLTVLLGGVSTPTIRNLVKNFRMSAQEILDAAEYIQDNYEGLEDIIDANREYAEIAETLLLKIANWMARDLAEFNAINIDRYNKWYEHGIQEIRGANLVSLQASQNVRDLIDAYDESVVQHRLQQRLFSGTNPTSSSKPVLFVISGQSNAVGSGEYGAYDHAEDCGQFWSWRDGANALKPIVDPIGKNGSTGSQWPAFARRFFSLTGRKIILLSIASGGSAVTDGGSSSANTWADNGYGNLRASATSIWNAFSAAVPASNYDLGAILWSQGETEASRIYAGTVTVEDYIDGTVDVLEWTRTLIGDPDCPVLNCEIGYINTAMTNSALKKCYEDIQQAQKTLFNSENGLYDICAMPPRYINAWNEFEYGVIHYSPIGYRIVGDAFARAAAHYLSL